MKNHSPFMNHRDNSGREAAIKLIRQRITDLYSKQPKVEPRQSSGLVDRFWQQHADHPNPHAAWQEFYAGLDDTEKRQLWNEYQSSNQQSQPTAQPASPSTEAHTPAEQPKPEPSPPEPIQAKPVSEPEVKPDKVGDSHAQTFEEEKPQRLKEIKKKANKDSLKKTKENLIQNVKKSSDKRGRNKDQLNKQPSRAHWRPLVISVLVMALWLLAQYNPLLVAFAKQYVSPGDTLRGPVIVDPSAEVNIGPEPRIIIPKINVDVPVVYELGTRDEAAIQAALEDGVVHYAGTSVPGQAGNNVIVGHSSNNFLNSGKYKFAFVLLDRLELGDTFILHFERTRYVYKVTNKQVIEPTDFSLTTPTPVPTATLITCTPPGTSWKRLVVQAEQISPAPTANQTALPPPSDTVSTPEDAIVPGNSPSLWNRFTNWLF